MPNPPPPGAPSPPTLPQRYGVFTALGEPQGFYSSDIYPPDSLGNRNLAIPPTAIDLTEEQYTQLVINQPWSRFIDGVVVIKQPLGSSQSDWGVTMEQALGGEY